MSEVEAPDADSFAALGLGAALTKTLSQLGYEEPTPIQKAAIVPLIAGRDILAQAATGTGKTAAFALPILERLAGTFRGKRTVALVLVPTRELAMQVAESVHRYGKSSGVQVLPIYGGQSMEPQLRALQRGVHVVVATPGRALDHLRRKTLDLQHVQMVVLDEADEMLDMGFAEDLEAILAGVPADRQTALFSATMPPRIASIAEANLKDPVRVAIAKVTMSGEVPLVRQVAYVTPRSQKLTVLERVLDMEAPTSALVFCRMRTDVDELTERLTAHGHRAEAIHGGLSQQQRDRVMKKFKEGSVELLIATDVAARGLDIKDLSHVINVDLPAAPEAYIHRIGRTGRAGKSGVAISLVEPREIRLVKVLQRLTKQRIEEGKVPTIADLRVRRLDLLRERVGEMLSEEDSLDRYRVLLDAFAETHTAQDIAAAALKLADTALNGGTAREPAAPARGPAPAAAKREPQSPREREPEAERALPAERGDHALRTAARGKPAREDVAATMAKLYLAVGRGIGVSAAEIVATIGQAVDRKAIGNIAIHDRHTVVEVPEEAVETILRALKKMQIKGESVRARRFRD
ncbi:MAG: DEAD/DEAH box helicase [Deltaproteobacteria bacterium]|nr:DEAD/DEAH box helicase [Deltaproteobacteria bacterium]